MQMDEPMETSEPSEVDRSGTKPDSTLAPEGAPREWWDDLEAADLREAAESGQVSNPVAETPDAPQSAEWWDDSFDATDEDLPLDPDSCKFGLLFFVIFICSV